MLAILCLTPTVAGAAVWVAGDRRLRATSVAALAALVTTLVVAVVAATAQPSTSMRWGAGLTLRLEVDAVARAPIVLVAFVTLAVVVYALTYGPERGRARMVGLLLVFAGTMELLLVAGDLLTLLMAWELVGALSWGLIAHHWTGDAPTQAAHAFLATRAGDLGLFVAAGAAFAGTGGIELSGLAAVNGGGAHALAAGVLLAAAAKSAQGPFAPWLFSAMAGPTPASALLHSATMVAAGAYLLARLQPVLDAVAWFGPTAIALGLATALAGGAVAAVQPEAKRLLAASTSAHYGLMIVAVGAGYPAVAVAHLVAHGLFKALLFIAAGVAIDASGTEALAGMGLGRNLRSTAALAAVGALALAAVPPLAGAWTKEEVVAAAAHVGPWIGILVVVAGGLSAFYAARFHLLAFGPDRTSTGGGPGLRQADRRRFGHARVALALLAGPSIALGVAWLPGGGRRVLEVTGGELPAGAAWELIASLGAVVAGGAGAVALARRGRLAEPVTAPAAAFVGGWFELPRATRVVVVDPTLALARAAARADDRIVDAGVRGVAGLGTATSVLLARSDDRVVDAGVRGIARLGIATSRLLARGDDRVVDAGVRGTARFAAWSAGALDRVAELGIDGAVGGVARLTGLAGRSSRRLQTGQPHQYYAGIAVGLLVLVTATVLWR